MAAKWRMPSDPTTGPESAREPACPAPSSASSAPTDDYDSPWKDIIHSAFPEFMAFFFRDAAARIDWSAGHEFLDTELRQVVQDAELGRRHADVLVRVTTTDGATGHVFVHVEVQGGREADFARRMFVYHYRLFDRFDAPVASFAVLADEDSGWKPDHFSFDALCLRHTVQFGIAKLLDHETRLEELQENPNPFALVTAAHLLTRRTRGDDLRRYEAKLRLIRLLYRQGWERQQVLNLFSVLDWMMRLPQALQQRLWQDVDAMDQEKRMAYVNTWEERGIEKGIEKGIQKGLQQGIGQGRAQGQAEILERLLTRRFGVLSDDIRSRLASAQTEQLERWADRVLDATTLAEIFGGH
jgi:hypothetical protein